MLSEPVTPPKSNCRQFLLALAGALLFTTTIFGQAQAPNKQAPRANKPAPPAVKKTANAPETGPNGEIYVHALHADKLGSLECSLCHTAVRAGSVELQRPGHDQCIACHADDFDNNYAKARQSLCGVCHTPTTTTAHSKTDLQPFPRYRGTRALLFQFSHARHVDQQGRKDLATGFRADCTFCHKFDEQGIFAKFPGHTECAACHSQPGVTPQLTPALDATGCVGCHTPQEIENPGFTENRRLVTQTVVSGKYVDIKFTHIAHFAAKQRFNLDCTTCHYAIPRSTSLSDLALPKMVDCVQCHDTSKSMPAEFRMSNCKTCHADTVTGLFTPVSHTRNVKPADHNEGFRIHHEQAASTEGAKCFVCHQNISPSVEARNQCLACHVVMRPVSHTARWKDDLHGKYAALDRTTCATCHQADYCIRCHNELPRSHTPLPVFAAGGHAALAMLDTRACLTCHTFQNTCFECHTGGLSPQSAGKAKPSAR
jgi:hypothetical protein